MDGSIISRIRAFLKRRAFAIGGLAVTIPLLVIIFLQYQALTTLNKTLPAYRKQLMRQYLMSVVEDFRRFYGDNAERALAAPAGSIDLPGSGVIEDDDEGALSQKAVARVADHFKKQDFKGASRYFIAVATEKDGAQGSEVYIRDGAANIAPAATSVDRNPRHRLIVKPILNESMRIVAAAGMVVDHDYFHDAVLPEAIRKSQAQFLPSEDQKVIVSLYDTWEFYAAYDGKGVRLPLSESEQRVEAEASQPFSLVYSNTGPRFSLSVRLKNLTVEQLARRNFLINLSLWAVMTLFLITAVALMLRTASREMKLTQMKASRTSRTNFARHWLRSGCWPSC